MDAYRFYVPDLLPQSIAGQIALPDDQSHHARSVLRLAPGDAVILFDGNGNWAEGTLSGEAGGGSKKTTKIALVGGIHVDPAPPVALTIATAVPKGERAEWLVEQASQLNVSCLQWIDCDRSVVKPREGGGKIDKWRRLAIESAKQCGRTHLMHVEEPLGLEAVLTNATESGSKVLWLEPREGGKSTRVSAAIATIMLGGVTALVGPEGGWSEREWQMLEEAAEKGRLTRVQLTKTILRIETACTAIAAIVMSAG